MSPAIAAPFPDDVGTVPDTLEQASEILTHIIEGYVIRESSEPFPVSRSALLSEMIRREQACALSKERKRKLENNNANRAAAAAAAATAATPSKAVTAENSTSTKADVPTEKPTTKNPEPETLSSQVGTSAKSKADLTIRLI